MNANKLSPLEKLDWVLKEIANNSHPINSSPDISHQDLYSILTQNGFNTGIILDYELIIKKLKKDGYIEESVRSSDIYYYSITLEGKILLQRNGYTQQEKDRIRERRNLNLVNFCLAVGTALAGVFALIEMIKMCLTSFFHCM